MWIFPLVAALVAFAFAAMLGRRFAGTHRSYELAWTISLAMYGVASLAVVAGGAGGWSRSEFRIYWLFGAVLNVPFLAAGELQLLIRKAWAEVVLWCVLAFVTAYTISVTAGAAIATGPLAERLPSGKDVFGDGTPAHRLPQLISIPSYLVLVGGALWSVWRMRGRDELRSRFAGTLLIALGATVIAGFGSAFAALGNLAAFSVSLLIGIAVMFAGFLRASRPAPVTQVEPTSA